MSVTWDSFAWLRIANVVFAIFAMTVMGTSFARKRKYTTRRLRRLALSQYFFLTAVAYGSGRAASLGAPVAEHVFFLFLSLAGLSFAWVWNPKGDETLPGPDDRAVPARAGRAFRYYWHCLRVAVQSTNEHECR